MNVPLNIDMSSNNARSDFESKPSLPGSGTDNCISRASASDVEAQIQIQQEPDEYEKDESFDASEEEEYIPKTEQEVNNIIEEKAGAFMRQATLMQKKKRGATKVEMKVNEELANMNKISAQMLADKISVVNSPQYLADKQTLLN